MVTDAASLLLFAIRSAIKLTQQIRRAYVDNLKRSELVLPLPNFPTIIDEESARNYFKGKGKKYAEEGSRIAELLEKSKKGKLNIESEKKEFLLYHQEKVALDQADNGDFYQNGLGREDFINLLTVRQWSKGTDPHPTALKRIAATLIEITVDYYADVPGALNENSSHAKVLKGFFTAIDDKDLVNTPADEIAEDLLVAVIETVGENSELLTGDDTTRQLVGSVAKGIAMDAGERIKKIRADGGNLAAEEKIRFWSQITLRSVLSNAGDMVLSNPSKFLDVKKGAESAMVTSVGNAVLGIILDEEKADLQRLFSRNALDRVTKAALSVLAACPELIEGEHEGLKNIIGEVARELSVSSQMIGQDMLPEVMRLILEKTSDNLELVWPGDFSKPGEHLLILSAREVLDVLSGQSSNGVWRPHFTKEQAMEVLESVLDEVIQNPGWIIKEAGEESSLLGQALEGAFDALQSMPGKRLSSGTVTKVFESAVKAVALRKEFLEQIPAVDPGQSKYLLTLALDSIFDIMSGDGTSAGARWVSSRDAVIGIVVDTVLKKLALEGVSEKKIEEAIKVLRTGIDNLSENRRFSLEGLIEEISAANL